MSLINNLIDTLLKTDSVIPQYHISDPGPKARTPTFNLKKLYDVVDKNWVLQEIYRAIIQESTRAGFEIKPKFIVKCSNCGMEYQETKNSCDVCGSKSLRDPDPRQRKRALNIVEKPNSDRETMNQILNSLTYHDLVSDEWYLSVEYRKMNTGSGLIPSEIKVRDPRYIHPVMNEYGKLGNGEYFCPICFDYKSPDIKEHKGLCARCGARMVETAYIQKVNDTITARWSVDQMIRGSTYRVLPNTFGTPRARSLWNIITIINVMDEWFMDSLSEGRLEKIVNFPGWDQTKLTQLMRKVQSEVSKLRIVDDRTGGLRAKKNLRVLYLSSDQPISVHDVGISPENLQLLEYYRMCIQACAGVYGVQAIFIGNIEKGKAGTTPAMQIEVQNRTTREIQLDKEETINKQLFPIFNITDWLFKFNPLEKKDDKQEAEIWSTKANTVMTLINAGFDVEFDEFNNIKVSRKPVRDVTAVRPTGSAPQKTKVSDASGQIIEGTSTQRKPYGTRESNDTDEEREKNS